jgi:hypothetical protein
MAAAESAHHYVDGLCTRCWRTSTSGISPRTSGSWCLRWRPPAPSHAEAHSVTLEDREAQQRAELRAKCYPDQPIGNDLKGPRGLLLG